MGALQPWHLILIVMLALILFGAGKLSDAGGALGKSIRDFRQAVKDPDQLGDTTAGRHCPQCGAAIKEDDRFCAICGASLAPRQVG